MQQFVYELNGKFTKVPKIFFVVVNKQSKLRSTTLKSNIRVHQPIDSVLAGHMHKPMHLFLFLFFCIYSRKLFMGFTFSFE